MAQRCFVVSSFCCGQNKAFWSAGIQALESDRLALNSQYCYLFGYMILGNSLISECPALISKIQTTAWVCASHILMSIKQDGYSNTGMVPYHLGRDREMWLHGNELLQSSLTFTTRKGRNQRPCCFCCCQMASLLCTSPVQPSEYWSAAEVRVLFQVPTKAVLQPPLGCRVVMLYSLTFRKALRPFAEDCTTKKIKSSFYSLSWSKGASLM